MARISLSVAFGLLALLPLMADGFNMAPHCSGLAFPGFRAVKIGTASCQRPRLGLRMTAASDMNLTPELEKNVQQFANVPDPKLRYQQLLYFAAKLPPMESQYKIEENIVKGCQSVVYVHAELNEDGSIQFWGDSDSQLTKVLACIVVLSAAAAVLSLCIMCTAVWWP